MLFDEMPFWRDPELGPQLKWYRSVATNKKPAKFRIAQQIPVSVELDAPLEELEAEFQRALADYSELFERVKSSEFSEIEGEWREPPPDPNLLQLIGEIAERSLAKCDFCRWLCRVDRTDRNGKRGTCKLDRETRVSTFFHHGGEEWIYRGELGSGTIFFTSCNMRCAFCQNGDISTDKDNGLPTTASELAAMAWLLRMEGCHNINWVGGEPTIHLHTIVGAVVKLASEEPSIVEVQKVLKLKSDLFSLMSLNQREGQFLGKFNAPLLWNSNFFMSEKTTELLYPLIDIWLPDFKFGPGRCAVRLSRTPWYWETVTGNLLSLRRRGEEMTIRHLVMPEHVECCTRPILEWIAENLPGVPVNIMDQYRPDNFANPHSERYDPKYREIARRPFKTELERAYRIAEELNIPYRSIGEL